MKCRKHLIGCLMAGILAFSGCGTGSAKDTEAQNPEQQDTAAQMDEMEIYRPILDQYAVLLSGEMEIDAEMDGVDGIFDIMSASDEQDFLAEVGYCIEDVSGDGVAELLIGSVTEEPQGNYGKEVLACYTIAEGKQLLVFEGWYRNLYYLMENGDFYHRGSAGAAYSLIGRYALSADGSALDCLDFYFTEPNWEDFDETEYFYNTTGADDAALSEEVTAEAYYQAEGEWQAQIMPIDFIPFTEYISAAAAE